MNWTPYCGKINGFLSRKKDENFFQDVSFWCIFNFLNHRMAIAVQKWKVVSIYIYDFWFSFDKTTLVQAILLSVPFIYYSMVFVLHVPV